MKTSLILAGLTAAATTQLDPLMWCFGFGLALLLVLSGVLVYDLTRPAWATARTEPRPAPAALWRTAAARARDVFVAVRDTDWLVVVLTLLALLLVAAANAWDAHRRRNWQPDDWRPGELLEFLADDYEEPWPPAPAAVPPAPFLDGVFVDQADAPAARVLATAGAL